jgi:purine-nucleoside phosphorylase
MKNPEERFQDSFNFLKERMGTRKPKVAVIFGSGLGDLNIKLENADKVTYSEIPEFPVSTVPGHQGYLSFGNFGKLESVFLHGRFHYYEGYSMKEVTMPVKILNKLGVKTLIVTNAAGGISPDFQPGDFMIINDHINLMGSNPLIGVGGNGLKTRFVDMSHAYEPSLIKMAETIAQELKMPIKIGVYAAMSGPSYETPSEVKMLKTFGADAVGMSTVPEVIVANGLGMKVLGISYISNLATGVYTKTLSHSEVLVTAEKIKPDLAKLIEAILSNLEKKIDEKDKHPHQAGQPNN